MFQDISKAVEALENRSYVEVASRAMAEDVRREVQQRGIRVWVSWYGGRWRKGTMGSDDELVSVGRVGVGIQDINPEGAI